MRARVTAETVARMAARLREAMGADPARLGGLALVLDALPNGYDPDETPDARAGEKE